MTDTASQTHKAFPYIAKLIGDCVHHNGGTAFRNFNGVADPQSDIMRLLDECLGAEGVYHDDLRALDDWLAALTSEQFDTVTDGEETEVEAIFATAPDLGNVPGSARAFIDNCYEHCI